MVPFCQRTVQQIPDACYSALLETLSVQVHGSMPKSLPANSHENFLQKDTTNLTLTWPIELVTSFSCDTEEHDTLLQPARATQCPSTKDLEGTECFDACWLSYKSALTLAGGEEEQVM